MTRHHIFTDESGNQDFRRAAGATRYFILTSITSSNHSLGDALVYLRRELAWKGLGLNSEFHATEDRQVVRDQVFALLATLDFEVHSTVIDKPKVHPSFRRREHQFYCYAWYEHVRLLALRLLSPKDEVLLVSATIGTSKQRRALYEQITPVLSWLAPQSQTRTAHWACFSDPCLQIADYCGWAIQRRWEQGDDRSYNLIASKIVAEELHGAGGNDYY